jgi:hypothetical protein
MSSGSFLLEAVRHLLIEHGDAPIADHASPNVANDILNVDGHAAGLTEGGKYSGSMVPIALMWRAQILGRRHIRGIAFLTWDPLGYKIWERV